jgi:hypothetical protein
MTPHQRPKAGSEEAPVVAPLAVLVTCALLVLSALLSYSAGTRHRRTVRGRRDRGRSSCWHHVRAGLWLRISDLRAAVGPLWTQAGAGARDGRTVTRDSWLGGRILTAHGGSAANNSGFCGGELFRSSAGVRWRSPSAEMAVHGDRRDVNRLFVGRHPRSGLCPGGGGDTWLALGIRRRRARTSYCCDRRGDDSDRADSQQASGQLDSEVS